MACKQTKRVCMYNNTPIILGTPLSRKLFQPTDCKTQERESVERVVFRHGRRCACVNSLCVQGDFVFCVSGTNNQTSGDGFSRILKRCMNVQNSVILFLFFIVFTIFSVRMRNVVRPFSLHNIIHAMQLLKKNHCFRKIPYCRSYVLNRQLFVKCVILFFLKVIKVCRDIP